MSTVKYKCDTCKRQIEILENREGLNNFSKCIITKGCRGKLYKTQRNPYNIRENFSQPVDLSLTNYSPRRAFFEFKKPNPSMLWEIVHNMGVYPSITVYEFDDNNKPSIVPRDNYDIKIIDKNTLELSFNGEFSGTAHLVARSSLDPEPATIEESEPIVPVTYNNVMTLAFLGIITDLGTGQVNSPSTPIYTGDLDIPIIIDIIIKEPNRDEIFCEEVFDSHSAIGSPWLDWKALLSRKRRNYSIRSKALENFSVIQDLYDGIDDIPDGTQFRITHVRYGEDSIRTKIRTRNVLMLLAEDPYRLNDKILDTIVDVGAIDSSINNNYVFVDGELHLYRDQLEPIYPIIEKSYVLEAPPTVIASIKREKVINGNVGKVNRLNVSKIEQNIRKL